MNSEEITPEKVLYSEISFELAEMVRVDQEMRQKSLESMKSNPGDDFWDSEVDKRNTERMKEIILEIGWPTVSKVGAGGMRDAWLIVQHADHDLDFQKQCLELMKNEPEGEVGKTEIGYLEDRTRVNSGQEQLYGTQFYDKDGVYIPRPIKDEENLEQRRAEAGMEPMSEYKKHFEEKYS